MPSQSKFANQRIVAEIQFKIITPVTRDLSEDFKKEKINEIVNGLKNLASKKTGSPRSDKFPVKIHISEMKEHHPMKKMSTHLNEQLEREEIEKNASISAKLLTEANALNKVMQKKIVQEDAKVKKLQRTLVREQKKFVQEDAKVKKLQRTIVIEDAKYKKLQKTLERIGTIALENESCLRKQRK